MIIRRIQKINQHGSKSVTVPSDDFEIGDYVLFEKRNNEWILKNLKILKNDSAILNPLITCLLSLAIIVIMYYMFMPMLWFISNTLISIGAPAQTTLFYMTLAGWGFVLFAVAALLILLAKVWRKTHDTGFRY